MSRKHPHKEPQKHQVLFDDVNPGALQQAPTQSLIAAIQASPVVGVAQVVSGLYGIYSSGQMADTLENIANLTEKMIAALAALKLEIEELKINDAVNDCKAAVISLRGIETLNDQDRHHVILDAVPLVISRTGAMLDDVNVSLTFAPAFAICMSFQLEVLKRQAHYFPQKKNDYIQAVNDSIYHGNACLQKLRDYQVSRVGPAQVTRRDQPIGHPVDDILHFYSYFYTLDGEPVYIQYETEHPSDSYLSDTEAARQAKLTELLNDKTLTDLLTAIESWWKIVHFLEGGGSV